MDKDSATIKEWDAYLKGKEESQAENFELKEKIRELEQVIRILQEGR
jgi:hypothetical protein